MAIEPSPSDCSRVSAWLAGLVVLVGFTLRAVSAWTSTYHADEYYSLFAAKMIGLKGLPIYPSGVLRVTEGPLLYLQAPFVYLFGIEPYARIPSVLASALGIWLVWKLGRRVVGEPAALVAALLFACDIEAVTWGARAKSYALLPTLALALLFAVRALALHPRSRRCMLWVAVGFVALLWTHPLTVLYCPAYALAYLVFGNRLTWRVVALLGGLGLVGSTLVFSVLYFGDPGLFESMWSGGFFVFPVDNLLPRARVFVLIVLIRWFAACGFAVAALGVIAPAAWWRRLGLERPAESWRRDLVAVISFFLVAFLGLASSKYWSSNYALALLPAFCLVAAAGLNQGTDIALSWGQRLAGLARLPRVASVTRARFGGLPSSSALSVLGIVLLLSRFPAAWNPVWQGPSTGLVEGYRYVDEHWQRGDAYLNADPCAAIHSGARPSYYYLNQTLRGLGHMETPSGLVDRILGAPAILEAEDLRAVLNRHDRIWLVMEERAWNRILPESRTDIEERMREVYRRGVTSVYLKAPRLE